MQTSDEAIQLPLQIQPSKGPLQLYMPHQDFPCQLNNHPFSQRMPTLSNHSLSKWACTELSTQDQKQSLEDQLSPLPRDIFTGLLSQATFKPKDLKEQLRSTNQLKKMLRQTLDKNKAVENQRGKKQGKGKTRYQKILQQFFQNKQKSKPSSKVSQINNFKEKYNPSSVDLLLKPKKQKVESASRKMSNRNYSHRQLPLDQIEEPPKVCPSNLLVKTFSQKALALRPKPQSEGQKQQKGVRQGWMRMNFTQRQQRVLSSRRDKQNRGRQLKIEKEKKQCTFKPSVISYKPSYPPQSVNSYAKLYLEKVRSRM